MKKMRIIISAIASIINIYKLKWSVFIKKFDGQ